MVNQPKKRMNEFLNVIDTHKRMICVVVANKELATRNTRVCVYIVEISDIHPQINSPISSIHKK